VFCGCKGSAFSENNKIFGGNFIKKRKNNRFIPFFEDNGVPLQFI